MKLCNSGKKYNLYALTSILFVLIGFTSFSNPLIDENLFTYPFDSTLGSLKPNSLPKELLLAPNNDDCSSAASLTPSSTCNYQPFTTNSADNTTGLTNPGCGGTPGKDVWFKFVAPSFGTVFINSQSVSGNNGMSNGAMALYSGSCNNLALIDCDDNSSDDGFMPAIFANGLVAGNTYYIRFWGVNNDNGDFKICIKTPSSCDLPCVNPISFTNGSFNNSNNTTFNIYENEIQYLKYDSKSGATSSPTYIYGFKLKRKFN